MQRIALQGHCKFITTLAQNMIFLEEDMFPCFRGLALGWNLKIL